MPIWFPEPYVPFVRKDNRYENGTDSPLHTSSARVPDS